MTLVTLLLTLALDRLLFAHRDPRVRTLYDRPPDAVARRLPHYYNNRVAALPRPALGRCAYRFTAKKRRHRRP